MKPLENKDRVMVDFNRLLQDRKHTQTIERLRLMAKQNVAQADTTPLDSTDATNNNEVDFDMPEEFKDDPSTPVSHNLSVGLSDADFDAKGFNNAQDEEEYAKLNPPKGDWHKVDSWEFERQVFADDCQPGDFDPKGRTFLIFKGRPETREANGMSYEPSLRLRISPDKRENINKPGMVDTAYKLFLKAKEMYIEKHGQLPETMNQYRSMLTHDSYFLTTMNGDNGIIVFDLKLKTFQRGNGR